MAGRRGRTRAGARTYDIDAEGRGAGERPEITLIPIYEYECRACGSKFEALVRPGSAQPSCPACQSQELERLLSLFAVSSETTKQQALKDGRKRSASVKREKDQAQMEYEKNHAH